MNTNTTKDFKLFGVIGNPIGHSLSPILHNSVIRQRNIQALYTCFMLPLHSTSHDLRNFILYSHLDGVNITLPFKEIALHAVDEISDMAQKIGALNTIVRRHDKLIGYNTDADGFWQSIIHIKPKKVLLLGAGGSARSIATLLSHHNVILTIANRSIEKLRFFECFGETILFKELQHKHDSYDIVINATSAGVDGKSLPLPKEILKNVFFNSQLAFDLMYQKSGLTPFCSIAHESKTQYLDGKAMLVYQGALAFLYFHDLPLDDSVLHSIVSCMAKSLNITV